MSLTSTITTTVTVDANQPMRDAVARLEGIADDVYVIVRRREDEDLYWYRFRAGFVREMAEHDPDSEVVFVLNLHESGAEPSAQRDAIDGQDVDGPVILLEGDRAVGILESAEPPVVRGIGPPPRPSPAPPASVGAPAPAGGRWAPVRHERPVFRRFRRARDESAPMEGGPGRGGFDTVGDAADAEDEPATAAPPAVGAPPSEAPFSAFPELDCPPQVAVDEHFDLVVRLAAEERTGVAGGPIEVDTSLPEFDLVVSVVADGFTTDRVRDVLHVVRSDLRANEVRFGLTAEPIEGQIRPAILQVDFSFGGVLCGRAWRAVAVTRDATIESSAVRTSGATIETTSTPVMVASAEDAPDLVVTITENDDSTKLAWQYTTAHAVTLPEEPITKRFRSHNAKSFAMHQIRLAHEAPGAAAVGNRMLGIARAIADEIPPATWSVLADVWAAAKADDRLPSVLLVSSDPYVPWELASTENHYIDEALVDPELPPFLGAQIPISRWTAPQPRGASAVLNPPLPPPSQVGVERMALVIGDYLAKSGQRPLPKAIEEGNMLAARYRALRLTATLDDIDPLFDGRLEHDGEPFEPDVVHFACHGEISANRDFNGIVLNEGHDRLDALYVGGNRMERPFVFLNACQIGQATQLLDDAGGMAEQFLRTGASGFVAPLWSVDDQLAQDTALDFYRQAIDEGVPVAEVLRRRRATFDADADDPQTTHLAYVYYGHPRLLLSRP